MKKIQRAKNPPKKEQNNPTAFPDWKAFFVTLTTNAEENRKKPCIPSEIMV